MPPPLPVCCRAPTPGKSISSKSSPLPDPDCVSLERPRLCRRARGLRRTGWGAGSGPVRVIHLRGRSAGRESEKSHANNRKRETSESLGVPGTARSQFRKRTLSYCNQLVEALSAAHREGFRADANAGFRPKSVASQFQIGAEPDPWARSQFRPRGFNVPLSTTDRELSPPPANHSAYRGVW